MKLNLSILLTSAVTSLASAALVLPLTGGDGLVKQLHHEWKAKYAKEYESDDMEAVRLAIFADNLQYISSHNERFHKGEVGFDMELNGHSDLTFEEWQDFFLAYTKKSVLIHDDLHMGLHATNLLRGDVPDSIDWRELGAVTPVKNQEQCGSCWTFASTGSMEGVHFLATGNLVSLSEEQLINCVHGGEFDCQSGGDMVEAFKYVVKNGGIVSEASDPYASLDHQKCTFKPDHNNSTHRYAAKFSGYKTVPSNDEDALKSAVAGRPVAVGIDASHRSFQFYHTGVYDEKQCCTDCKDSDLDHGVLVVGYGTEDGKDYWLIKNSWAADWGDAGYIKIIRNDDGRCGVAAGASYPIA